MTNKVKPFFIRITDEMTPQMVQDAFDKCVNAGAHPWDGIYGTKSSYEYKNQIRDVYPVFGVDEHGNTDVNLGAITFGEHAQEITLDQLDEWLGLEVEEGWKVGDVVTIKNPEGLGVWDEANKYLGSNGTVMAVFTNTNGKKVAAVSHDDNVCICWVLSMLSKPETPEQKAERERLETVKQMWSDCGLMPSRFDVRGLEIEKTKKDLFALYDAGYRKQ